MAHITSTGDKNLARRSIWRRILPLLLLMPSICLVLTAFITWVNVGFVNDFGLRWARGFIVALPVMGIALLLMGSLDRLVQRHFGFLPVVARKILLALVTAAMLKLLLSSVVTLTSVGAGADFFSAWFAAFLKSLPLGLVISLFMGFVVKPRLDRALAA